ncbi:hypothetical protein JTE90_011239 [Oedothorax gibbosus]|uniref:Uncharacterized protein n=1 Tax=Oedothorax gibbosus TaxID=931172 RepID=A0AAV6VZL5_9ARAC|nr:hypothetical protein JTE90_011239 [Oedothorax gibbosus]
MIRRYPALSWLASKMRDAGFYDAADVESQSSPAKFSQSTPLQEPRLIKHLETKATRISSSKKKIASHLIYSEGMIGRYPALPRPAKFSQSAPLQEPRLIKHLETKATRISSSKIKIASHLIHSEGMIGRYPALSRLASEMWDAGFYDAADVESQSR